MSPASGQRLNNEPLSYTTPLCRGGAHSSCKSETCACECHDDAFVNWEDPPAPARGPNARTIVNAEMLDALRRHPGRWARVKDYKSYSGAASAERSFRSGKWGSPDFEVTARRSHKSSALYMRYLLRPVNKPAQGGKP